MLTQSSPDFFSRGIEALQHEHLYLARVCFEKAFTAEPTPRHSSYFALALARSRGAIDEALPLAEDALRQAPDDPLHYLNLGRIYLLAGRRLEAAEIFRRGVRIERQPELLHELENLGTRRPLFRFLHRDHLLNKHLGRLCAWLGLRRCNY